MFGRDLPTTVASDIPAGDDKIINLFLQCSTMEGALGSSNLVYLEIRY